MPKRILRGVVVSDKRDKTVTVKVDRRVSHPIYKKIITKSKKYHAHDENNQFKEGDVVSIVEAKPFSKTKKWEVVYSDAGNIVAKADNNQKAKENKSAGKKATAKKAKK